MTAAGIEPLWAKSAGPGELRGETLVQHTENVLRALAGLCKLRPDLPVQVDCPRFWHLCFWTCVLHDFGKAAGGFQQQVKPGGTAWNRRHEVLSLGFIDWLVPNLEQPDRAWLTAAIASHHKDIDTIKARYPLEEDPADDVLFDMVRDLTPDSLGQLWQILTVQAPVWRLRYGFDALGVEEIIPAACRDAPPAPNRDAVAARLRDFHRLYRGLTQEDARAAKSLLAVALRGTIITADHQASAHTFRTRPTALHGADDLLGRLGRDWHSLHAHQRQAAEARGSRLLTAPTGSGKTEAALLWASNQGAAGLPPVRLFYVLPFQASMNAMHQRLSRTFPRDVGLQHGRSLHALYREVLDAEPDAKRAEAIARREKNLAGLHQHPIRVLSPYQILKACYRLRGYEAILSDLYGALFVLDEIHAYEPARLALILKMLTHLRWHYGARFFAMSATLPALLRSALCEALGIEDQIAASAHLYARYCRHTVHLLDGDLLQDGVGRIIAAVQDGHSVLVCCNTVRRAQAAWRQLRTLLPVDVVVDLLHSGFNPRDRLGKEHALLDAMAAGAARTKQVVLVATQVVEVSLNIDFDVLYSDPAPLDALLQRFGRVNRLGLRGLAPVHVFSRPDDGQHVYDPALVQGALAVLRQVNGQPVDESRTSAWLDQIYAGDVADAWQSVYRRQATEFEAACLGTLHAFQSDETLEEAFYAAFDAVEVLPASLEQEFGALRQANPLDADSLLVSIRVGQYSKLKKLGRVRRGVEQWPAIVDVPYSPETGLITSGEE